MSAWLAWLIVALAINAVVRWLSDRRHESEMRTVHRVLVCWAEHWGDPPEIVKPKLLQALKE
jgi:hypothetical protein